MERFPVSPTAMLCAIWRHRGLIRSLLVRDVSTRYRGSVLGALWSLLNPLVMLAIYSFVFGVIFQAKWGDGTQNRGEFALTLFIGLLIFGMFSECLNRAPSHVVSNVGYVKKINFPLEVLPLVGIGSAAFQFAVGFVVWVLFHTLLIGPPPLTILWLPVVLLPLFFMMLAAYWLLASLGVYLRDIGQVTGMLTTVLLFLSPVFYPVSALPALYQPAFALNPLTSVIEQTRNVAMHGHMPDWHALLPHTLLAALIAWAGFAWFQKTRRGFADVL